MDLTTCELYELNRKRDLYKLLKVNGKREINEIINKYTPYIANKGKKRLIEPTYSDRLKRAQKRIQILLKNIKFDDNIFSGIQGKSYIDNGKIHLGCKYVVALDISKFFPNTNRNKVYNFFKYKMKESSDVAKILTDICIIDIDKIKNMESIYKYMNSERIKVIKHIPTGSPISCILSYLVNYDMFKEISELAKSCKCIVSIYVDDVVISSTRKISKELVQSIINIVNKNGYKIQKSKLKYYNVDEYKRVTGNIISKDGSKLVIPNKIKHKIIRIKKSKERDEQVIKNKIRGLKEVIRQIEKVNDSVK